MWYRIVWLNCLPDSHPAKGIIYVTELILETKAEIAIINNRHDKFCPINSGTKRLPEIGSMQLCPHNNFVVHSNYISTWTNVPISWPSFSRKLVNLAPACFLEVDYSSYTMEQSPLPEQGPIMMEDLQPTMLQTQISSISYGIVLLLHGQTQLIQSPVYDHLALTLNCISFHALYKDSSDVSITEPFLLLVIAF